MSDDTVRLDLNQILNDMERLNIETRMMTYELHQGHPASAAIVFVVGPNTEKYLEALTAVEEYLNSIEVWPH